MMGKASPCFGHQPHYAVAHQMLPPVPPMMQHYVSPTPMPDPNAWQMSYGYGEPRHWLRGRWRANQWQTKGGARGNAKGQSTSKTGKSGPTALPGDGDRICAVCKTKHKDQLRTHCRNPDCNAQLKKAKTPNDAAVNEEGVGGTAAASAALRPPAPPSYSKLRN